MIQANEKLMNLDYVMADEEIKSDIDTINKVWILQNYKLSGSSLLVRTCRTWRS